MTLFMEKMTVKLWQEQVGLFGIHLAYNISNDACNNIGLTLATVMLF